MTHSTSSPEGDKPLYKDKDFWTQVVLPILCALGFGIGAGALAEHEAQKWEKTLQSSGDTTISAPVEAQSNSAEVR